MEYLLKGLLIFIAAVLCLALLLVGGLNIAKFPIYSEYYLMEETLCTNPGLNDGFVCQGICVSEENDVILVSGYMADKSHSRIYVTDFESNSYYVELTRNGGEKYTGHAGGIALTGDTVYISNGSKLYVFSLTDVLNAKNGDKVDIGEGVKVNSAASFVYADEEYVYVGEFNNPAEEQKEHIYGENHSIIEKYSHDDLENPVKIYSIGNYAQGVCFTPDGKVILSTSYGLTSTVYYVYNEADAIDSGLTLDGAPLYYLNGCIKEMKGPAMGEDLDYYEGKVITLTESASDKYIFGKFFFANKIVAIEF